MKNLFVKKNVEMIDGVLFLKGSETQLEQALVGVVDLLGYDIYHTEMLACGIDHRMNRETQISVPMRTDRRTWEKIKTYTTKSLIAAKEKAVAC